MRQRECEEGENRLIGRVEEEIKYLMSSNRMRFAINLSLFHSVKS